MLPRSATARGSASSRRPTTTRRWPRWSRRRSVCLPRPGLSLVESIVEFLRPRSCSLVLDNCEHLLDAAGDFAERVAPACPSVRVLATSREALGVDGEQRACACGRSTCPTRRRRRRVGASDAVRLFVERARRRREPAFGSTRQAPAVAEICRRLDGIPLAIELAAARSASMSPARDRRAPRRAVPAPHRRAPRRGRTPPDAAGDGRLVVLAARRRERSCSTASASSPARSTPRPRSAVVGETTSTGGRSRDALASLVAKSMLDRRDRPDGRPATRCSRPCGLPRDHSTSRATRTSGAGATPTNYHSPSPKSSLKAPGARVRCSRSDRLLNDLDNVRARQSHRPSSR